MHISKASTVIGSEMAIFTVYGVCRRARVAEWNPPNPINRASEELAFGGAGVKPCFGVVERIQGMSRPACNLQILWRQMS